jgi:hypothetical protein
MVETVAGLGDVEGIGDEEDGTEDENIEGGIRFTKKLKDPLMPSVEEVAEHRITHLPYRNWCRHCVRGRGIKPAKECPDSQKFISTSVLSVKKTSRARP